MVERFTGVRSTPKIQAVEEVVGVSLSEYLIHAHTIEGLSTRKIAKDIAEQSQGKVIVTRSTVTDWIHAMGVPVTQPHVIQLPTREQSMEGNRRSHLPEAHAKRLESLEDFWNDPVRYEPALEKIHSDEAQEKRSASLRAYWETKPRPEKPPKPAPKPRFIPPSIPEINPDIKSLVERSAQTGDLYSLPADDQFILGTRYLNSNPKSHTQLGKSPSLPRLNSKQATQQHEARAVGELKRRLGRE